MQKTLKSLGLTALVLSYLFLLLPQAVQAQTYTFTYSNFFPPSHIQSQLAEAWCAEVEKRTDGQVKIHYYPGETLTQAAQVYDGVVTGRSDIGMSCLLYTRGRFPLMDVINLPFGNPNGRFATAAFNEIYEQFQPEELADTHVLYLHAHGPGLIHTKDKPVRSMEDLKGMKIRSPGPVAQTLEALGATPVSMPMPDVYQSLQRGVVDGAVYPIESSEGWKLGEVTNYSIANYEIAYSVGFFTVMNKDKWNSLPADIQDTITEVNQEWAIKTAQAWDAIDYEGVRFTMRQGNTMIGIGTDEARKWAQAIEPVFDKYTENCADRGVPGTEALEFLRTKLEEYRAGKFESDYYAQ